MLDIENGITELQMGSGGRANAALINEIFIASFPKNPLPFTDNDQAVFDFSAFGAGKAAFTTDSHIVNPLFFNGGDIGTLAVNGTINDLAVGGAVPLYLSAAFVIAEGFPLSDLKRIAESMGQAARQAKVFIITGDTKVAEKAAMPSGVFINTAGVGFVKKGIELAAEKADASDVVIVSGSLGEHEISVLAAREGISFDREVKSDCAALHTLTQDMLAAAPYGMIKCIRDLTRGGLAAALNEIALSSVTEILIKEEKIPVLPDIKAAADIFGFDVLNLANEGKIVVIVKQDAADSVLAAMRKNPLGRQAEIIGSVVNKNVQSPIVKMLSVSGGTRLVQWLYGSELPRIC